MAMAVDDDDDHWPSLAPIRTSAASASLHACDTICKSSNVEENCLQDGLAGAACGVSLRSAPFNACSPSALDRSKAADTNLARQSSFCITSKKSCVDFLSCFSCTKRQTSSSPRPAQPRCTPTCMRKNGPVLRSMAFLFPTGGFQSFYSSPTGKAAQLSGAFPRTLSTGKLHHLYASPRTPSGKTQHFSSPRTPGSGRNLQCLSTPASGKVQHFSGAITSPRTPYGLGAASPSSARRRKSSFTLFMPPATADKKKAVDQQDEPTSPHVTCIGRVGRQTQCKKLHHKDVISPHLQCDDTTAKKNRMKPHSSTCHSTSSNEATKSATELSTLEACKQKFGRNQLHNLYKIHGFGDESGNADVPDQAALDCNQGDDSTLIANGHKDLMHLDSRNHGKPSFFSNVECIDDNMRSLQKADHDFSANVRMCSVADDKVELADTPVLRTACSQTLNDLQQEAHPSKCLEILNELQREAHQSQCQKLGLQLSTCNTPQSTDPCLLLIRSTSSRKLSEIDRSSLPCMNTVESFERVVSLMHTH